MDLLSLTYIVLLKDPIIKLLSSYLDIFLNPTVFKNKPPFWYLRIDLQF